MLPNWSRTIVVSLVLCAFPAVVQAGGPTAADRATARQLMLDGRNLRYDGNLMGALEKFLAADALMGVPTTGLELAQTQAELGLLVEAQDTCSRVIRHPETRGEPQPFREARRAAMELREQLRQRTPHLRFVFPTPEDSNRVELRVDGVLIPREAHPMPRFVNPGKHQVVVIVGPRRRVIPVTVAEGEGRDVSLVLPESESNESLSPEIGRGPDPWVLGGFTTAAAGTVLGSVAGVLAWSERKKLDDACPDRMCSAQEMERLDRAYGYANVSTYAFIVGGIGAAVGVGALFASKANDPRTDVGVGVTPAGGGALRVTGTF